MNNSINNFEYLNKEGVKILVNNFNNIINGLQKEVDELKLKNGGDVTLKTDMYVSDGALETSNIDILNLNGHELTSKGSEERGDTVIISKGDVEIKNGKIIASENRKDNSGVVRIEGSSNVILDNVEIENGNCVYVLSNEHPIVTINNCVLTTDASQAVYVGTGNGKVIINSGEFNATGYDSQYTLNLKDTLVNEDGSNVRDYIEVFGGKFHNYDPSNANSEPIKPVNFVADGYKVVVTKPEVMTFSVNNNEVNTTIYEVIKMSEAERYNKIKEGGHFKLNSNFVVPSNYALTLTKDIELDLNNYEITGTGHSSRGDLIEIQKATVTLKNGTIQNPINNIENDAPVCVMGNSNVTLENINIYGERCVMNTASNNNIIIKSGNYISPNSTECVYYSAGSNSKITIEGGYFENKPYEGKYFTLNIKDGIATPETAKNFIEVKGGAFKNFNPMNCETEGEGTNFVAEGYMVGESKSDEMGNKWYAVAINDGSIGDQTILSNGVIITWPNDRIKTDDTPDFTID